MGGVLSADGEIVAKEIIKEEVIEVEDEEKLKQME